MIYIITIAWIVCEIISIAPSENNEAAGLISCIGWCIVFFLGTIITLLPLICLGVIYFYGIIVLLTLFPYICLFSMIFGFILALL